jgi:dihydroorotase
MPGVPAEAEELMVFRDIALSRLTGTRVHIQHLSTEGAVELVRAAKAKGLPVTAEATPHHLSLTHAEVADYNPVFKVNPPLRRAEDVAAVRAGLADGTIDAIATDHAPHTQEVKEHPFDQAPCGMLGLETALGVALTSLTDHMDLPAIMGALTWKPAAIAHLQSTQGGAVTAGRPANLCVFDPTERWTVEPARSASRSRNTPFAGRELTGRVRHTILRGEPVVVAGEAQR